MRYLVILFLMSSSQLLISQDTVDLTLLQGVYDDPSVYIIDQMEKGPMKFYEDLVYNIKYDVQLKKGTMSDEFSGEKPLKVTDVDSVLRIEITYNSSTIKKGVIERCDHEMLKIKFETTIEEYMRKN